MKKPVHAPEPVFPMRLNKYLAREKYCTRREADEFIAAGKVLVNGSVAALGTKVNEQDTVVVRFRAKKHRYYAYHKPRGVVTHSPQLGEPSIESSISVKGIFPIGRLDKDSSGLILLTDDGRITDLLLNPAHEHEKEYTVTTNEPVAPGQLRRFERGITIEQYRTRPAKVKQLGTKKFSITLTEGKKHQVRRMCAAVGYTVASLVRTRVMNIKLGSLPVGQLRPIEGAELKKLLDDLAATT